MNLRISSVLDPDPPIFGPSDPNLEKNMQIRIQGH